MKNREDEKLNNMPRVLQAAIAQATELREKLELKELEILQYMKDNKESLWEDHIVQQK